MAAPMYKNQGPAPILKMGKMAAEAMTGGPAAVAMDAMSQGNSPLSRMAGMYNAGKGISDNLSTSDAQKMQGLQGGLQSNFRNAIDPKTTIANAVAALDHPDADPAHVAYAAPELLAAHHFGDKGNDALTHWYSLQDVEG